jgi:signal transduction histidine kinase
VAVFDLDGRMILANDALARIGGAPGADQMLRDLSYYRDRYDLVSPEGQIVPAEEWPIAAILRGESVSERRLVVRRRMDGQETPVSMRGTPVFDSEGRPELALIVLRDLTGQNRAEETLHKFALLVEASNDFIALALVARDLTLIRAKEEQLRQARKNEAIGLLTGGVAHDFNNLLTAINGYSDILLETMPGDDAKRGFVEEIQAAGRKAASRTSQLLAYSRKQVLQTRILHLNDLVRESARLLRRIIGEDIVLSLELDPALLPVKADPNQIHQALLNLCINSRDAMPGGGDLTIATRNAPTVSEAARSRPDTGCPMVVLEREGYAVLEARDGLEGETLLESTGARPDLLLTDVIMPRMGGIQLARSVRKSHPEIPILLMSGYTEEDFNRQEEPGETLPIVQKPFTSQALLGRILELIGASGKA